MVASTGHYASRRLEATLKPYGESIMAQTKKGTHAINAARNWEGQDITTLLSKSAAGLPAISATESGTPGRSISFTATTHDSPIDLGAGIPDPKTLPASGLQKALDNVLATASEDALRYGGVFGFEDLRKVLAERQGRIQGVELRPENFLMTHGGSGGIDAVCDTFLNPGDVVIAEQPNFSGSLRTIRGHLCKIVEVPLGEDDDFAVRVAEAIQRVEASGKRVKLLYTVPDFHNPTGATMSLATREALVDVCAEHQVFIMEDMAYTEAYFNAPPPPPLYAIADGHGVIQVGSFSKIIATGLRVGWIQARLPVIESVARVRFDMGGSPLVHRALAQYVDSGELEPHADQVRALYRQKCETLVASLREHCEPYLNFKVPDGGFFLWAECIGAKAQDVAREAAIEGVTFAAGSNFFATREEADTTHIRLALSYATIEELSQVGPRLRDAFRRVVD
jgi:2-aminoadipate transaminase